MQPELERAFGRLLRSWRAAGLSADQANPNWVHLLAKLDPDTDVDYELFDQPTVGPPRTWEWPYVSGEESVQRTLSFGDPLTGAREQYEWLSSDLTGACYLTGYRGQDLAQAWLSVTQGHRLGRLAGVGIARALFETGLEAFRVSTMTFRTLEDAPKSSSTLTTFGDGLWVYLHRYVGGEKTDRVDPRDQTRNTLSNIKWLRSKEQTARLASAYDHASEYLHAGPGAGSSDAKLAQTELLLLATGASGTLQSYQRFKQAADLVESMRGQLHEGPYDDVCILGADPNLPPKALPTSASEPGA